MTILQKARMNLYEVMESGSTLEVLDASKKLDNIIVEQMKQKYRKKKAEVA